MAIRTELSLRLPNSPGALGRVCGILGDQRVNVFALTVERGGTLRMVVDNPLRAAGALAEQEYTVEERDVLLLALPNGPGALGQAARLLAAADVNVEYAYASALEGQPLATVVIGVEDAERAATVSGAGS
jgi:hypothetical protein